jgi:hypothetical protein
MDRRDEELLERQLRHLAPKPPRGGVAVLAIVSVFFAGVAVGSFLFHARSVPVRLAAAKSAPEISMASAVRPIPQP